MFYISKMLKILIFKFMYLLLIKTNLKCYKSFTYCQAEKWGNDLRSRTNNFDWAPFEKYFGHAHLKVNECLRNNKFCDECYVRSIICEMQEIFKNAPKIDENIIVYRLVNEEEFNRIKNSVTGHEDPGFLSTTLYKDLCKIGTDEYYLGHKYLLKIYVNKGNRAIYAGVTNDFRKFEQELLFPFQSVLVPITGEYDDSVDKKVIDCLYFNFTCK